MAYSPLIGTLTSSIPIQLTAALSVGLVTTDTILEYVEKKQEIDKNGFNFLLNMNAHF